MLLERIQDKFMKVDYSCLASFHRFWFQPEHHQPQGRVLESCMQWFHETVRSAMMSTSDELRPIPAVTSANMLPYIRLISE